VLFIYLVLLFVFYLVLYSMLSLVYISVWGGMFPVSLVSEVVCSFLGYLWGFLHLVCVTFSSFHRIASWLVGAALLSGMVYLVVMVSVVYYGCYLLFFGGVGT
jgi:hypothetical protein